MKTNRKQARRLWLSFFAMLMPILASAYDFEVDNIYYNIISSTELTVEVTYSNSQRYSGTVTIPSTVSYKDNTYVVTSIGDNAFYYCRELTSINIPEGVTSIGGSAFNNCSSLISIIIPESVTSIGGSTFEGCSGLKSITIPKNVQNIGWWAFQHCDSLTSVVIPEDSKLELIDGGVFFACKNLTSINIPASVKRIELNAFTDCSSLTSVTIPKDSRLEYIGEGAFEYCRSLNAINIPKSVEKVGFSAFNATAWYESQPEGMVYLDDWLIRYKGTIPKDVEIGVKEGTRGIADRAFIWDDNLTSITLPNSVKYIGNEAFISCRNLTSITISDSIMSIGYGAFSSCSELVSIRIPEGITDIKGALFQGCSNLSSITLPSSVTNIDYEVFKDCSKLVSINIPENVTSIGGSAFENCSKLTSINIPEGVTSIKYGAFRNCSALTDLHIESIESWLNIEFGDYEARPNHKNAKNIYMGGKQITEVVIPDTISFIPDYSFYNFADLTYIVIPEGVTSIGVNAFNNCNRLQRVVNYSSLPITKGSEDYGRVAYYAKNVVNTKECTTVDGFQFLTNENGHYLVNYAGDEEALVLPNNYNGESYKIDDYAFYGRDVHSVTIGSGVLSVGDNVFSNTPSKVIWLTNTPPAGYAKIKGDINYVSNEQYTHLSNAKVYPYLSSMFEVDGVKYVPVIPSERTCHAIDCAYDSTAVKVAIGETTSYKNVAMKVTEVMPYTFYGNSHIKEVEVSHLGNICDFAFFGCDSVEYVTATNMGYIGNDVFNGCTSLKAIALGDSISALGDKAFYECSSLQEIIIPDSVRSIGEYCFAGCSALAKVEFGDSIATISDYTFQDCASLSEIRIPQSITTIGDYTFSGCTQLTDVVIEERADTLNLGSNGSSALFADCPLDSVYIGGKITYNTSQDYGYSPFYRNTSLRTVVITDCEEQIFNNEFYGCTNLKDVTIGNGVRSIGDYAFSGCSSLVGFSFGSSMEAIGAEAFSDCINLASISSHAIIPPICGTQALDDINKWSCILHVPVGYADTFQMANQWKEFFFIEDVVKVKKYVLSYMVDDDVYYSDTLAHKETTTIPDNPIKEGHTFEYWSDSLSSMPTNDVIINAVFSINKYLVTFKIGDEVIAADSLEYGAAIVAPEAPEKEGHTFDGWSQVPEVVPANDITIEGSYSVNSYLLSYTVDGDTVQTDSVAYGTAITLLEEPTKEGHTFSGWSEAPETMPANDVIISGTFAINKYLVTFKIGDEVIAADSLEYGAVIVAPEAPEKEGYTFDGWGEVADSVPANDLTYEGTYTVNIYKVYYYVGEELVHTAEVAYGEAIPEYVYEPTEEGYTFLGWVGETYETMPAHDVTYMANIDDGIEHSTLNPQRSTIYDLTGRKILNTENLKGGIYIVNGKKMVIK